MKLSEICICVGNLKLFSSVVQGRKVKLKIFMYIYFKGRFQVSFHIKFLVLPLTLPCITVNHVYHWLFQIGQMQGGLMGFIQKILLKAQHHIFFERSEIKDRHLVVSRWLQFARKRN